MSAMPQEPSRDSSIRLYAELLPNIRQVTLYVSLPPSSNKCNIALSTDCQTVETSYDAESVKLKLPARVSEASRERLRFDDEQKKGELSFRLVVDENRHVSGHEEGDGVNGPWSAVDLGPNTKLRCRRCQNTLLRYHSRINRDSNVGESSGEKTSSTMIFKDLPSQNWAEMMDFWHCHKPDEPGHGHDHNHSHGGDGQNPENTRDQNGAVKGYGASNRVVATAGTVLVDVSSFVLAEDDGVGLIKESSKDHGCDVKRQKNQAIKLLCRGCGVMLGVEDSEVATGGWRIYKAGVSVCPGLKTADTAIADSNEDAWETYPVETVVAAQLLEAIEREGVRRFVVHCSDNDDGDGILLWVFNPELRYSSSCPPTATANRGTIASQRAMKVFYQYLSSSKVESLLANELGERQPTSVGDLDLHSCGILEELDSSLKRSTEMLPVLARKFQEWNVGVMDRV